MAQQKQQKRQKKEKHIQFERQPALEEVARISRRIGTGRSRAWLASPMTSAFCVPAPALRSCPSRSIAHDGVWRAPLRSSSSSARAPPALMTAPAPRASQPQQQQQLHDDDSNYVSPLSTRYASAPMRHNFSDVARFRLWRQLWIALADAQRQLGLPITQAQVDALRNAPDVDVQLARSYERKLRHDVMSHVHALGDQVPRARAIIHLGATSCFVSDNSDIIQMRLALDMIIASLWQCISNLSRFAMQHRELPTLAFTHLQPAQPTTVGKRAALWLQDLLFDAHNLEHVRRSIKFRGVKGTTGTQASFLGLFDGDHHKVTQLDHMVTRAMGFEHAWPITGQTYSRKQDFLVLSALAGVGQSAAKMANDVRLLQHMKEMEEPFETHQVGSSAMAYKRNPMRCERINALSRFLQTLLLNPAETASTQWLERTLDDSANRRLANAEAFLSCDAIVQLLLNVSDGLVVYPHMISKHLQEELPFMATESILMAAVRAGGDRQQLHEALRVHSMEAARRVKQLAQPNDLLQRIERDALFAHVRAQLPQLCDARAFVGRAAQQVQNFVQQHVQPQLQSRAELLRHVQSHGDVRV
eukprot:TRINITY_DN376_c1_g4_i1.p1 TRINITY_DN376_c1_g4~~TRINITY_DN376_c1_g4_i1.p1  ORF type:complete len:633 (+),score=176.12 TRINITY_DN376_c1_g4_i1:139-1899(+)